MPIDFMESAEGVQRRKKQQATSPKLLTLLGEKMNNGNRQKTIGIGLPKYIIPSP